jgi:hypothetical protein
MPNRASEDPPGDFSVFIGARHPAAHTYLDGLVDESWGYCSRRDSA